MMRNQSAPSSAPSWKGASHQVLEASNGRHGLELYRERSADLIITDLVMPEMNGLEMIMELIKVFRDVFRDVKVIAMSGGVKSEGALRLAKLLGARQTLHKPIDMDELLSAVRYNLAH